MLLDSGSQYYRPVSATFWLSENECPRQIPEGHRPRALGTTCFGEPCGIHAYTHRPHDVQIKDLCCPHGLLSCTCGGLSPASWSYGSRRQIQTSFCIVVHGHGLLLWNLIGTRLHAKGRGTPWHSVAERSRIVSRLSPRLSCITQFKATIGKAI